MGRLSDMTYEETRQWAERLAQTWFLDPRGMDRLRVAGINAGWAMHVDASETLARLAGHLARGEVSDQKLSAMARVKALGYDRALRAVAGAATGGRSRDAPGRLAVLAEIPTPSMTDSVGLVARHLVGKGVNVWAADPRVRLRLARLHLQPTTVALPMRRQFSLVRQAHRESRSAWMKILADPPTIVYGDRDVTQSVLAALRPLVERSVPWIAAEAAALQELLERIHPPAVLVASDQHRMGRIVTELAPEAVVVVQHGLPQAEVGYLPVVAKKVAVWSEASRDWFVQHGTPRERLEITGNPRYDPLVAGHRTSLVANRVRRSGGGLRVLLALSPTDPARNRALIGLVMRGISHLPGVVLIVKLHPGQSDWSWVRAAVRQYPILGQVRLLRREPVSPILLWADATIVHRSTVALDSLVAGTPVIVGVVDESPNAANSELESLRLPLAHDPRELRDALLEFGDALSTERYFSERASDIQRLAGPTDNGAAERIAAMAAS